MAKKPRRPPTPSARSNHIKLDDLKNVLKPMKKPPLALEFLANDPDPILFATFEAVHHWFYSIRNKLINSKVSEPYYIEETSVRQAISRIMYKGDVQLSRLLSRIEKNTLATYCQASEFSTEKDILDALPLVFQPYVPTKKNTYDHEMFNLDTGETAVAWVNLSPRGRTAYYCLARKAFPKESCYREKLDSLLSREYRLPAPDTEQFVPWKMMVKYDSIVTVPYEVWEIIQGYLSKKKLGIVRPPLVEAYYQTFAAKDSQDPRVRLIADIEDALKNEAISEGKRKDLRDTLNSLDSDFKRSIIDGFGPKNDLLFTRTPLVWDLIVRTENGALHRSLKEQIKDCIKRRNIDKLKERCNSDLLWASVFGGCYYDLAKAFEPDTSKQGKPYPYPKTTAVDFILPLWKAFRDVGLSSPRLWTLKALNVLVDHDLYSEESFISMPHDGFAREGWLCDAKRRG